MGKRGALGFLHLRQHSRQKNIYTPMCELRFHIYYSCIGFKLIAELLRIMNPTPVFQAHRGHRDINPCLLSLHACRCPQNIPCFCFSLYMLLNSEISMSSSRSSPLKSKLCMVFALDRIPTRDVPDHYDR